MIDIPSESALDNLKSFNNLRIQEPITEYDRISEGLPPWTSVSFACGGWLQFYLFGVARAIQAKGLDTNCIYCGCSAGNTSDCSR